MTTSPRTRAPATRGRSVWRQRRARALRIGVMCLGVLVVACAGKDRAPAYADYDRAHAERLLSVGYQDIAEIYIDEVAVRALAVSGLRRLATVDPELTFEGADDALTVRHGSRSRTLPVPAPQDADGWAEATAELVAATRRFSPLVADLSGSAIYEILFTGMAAQLDRYSRYAGADKARENRAHRDGFGGIGVRIKVRDTGIEVLSVMDGSPAERAGLAKGDLIVAVDGKPTEELGRRGGVRALRGPIDTEVRLTVRRASAAQPTQVAVTRAHIVPETVSYEPRERTAYLRLTGFNQRTAASLEEALGQAQAEMGDRLEGYVLDLRDNPGGLLDQAVDVADLFVADGRIVSTHGRHPDSHQYFDADAGDVAETRPIVVLINAESASASEIVAAALQDNGRALVLGSTSYGKGTVQTVLRLPNNGELTLTWARFMAPSGYALSRHGVVPNVCTSLTDGTEVGQMLRQVRRGALAPRNVSPANARDDEPAADLRKTIAKACPSNDRADAVEIELARELLHRPDLFDAARAGEPPHLAKAYAPGAVQ